MTTTIRTVVDLHPGDTAYLVPRTMSAPSICYREPRAAVVRVEWPYLVVTVDGEEHRVHADNVRLSSPYRATREPVTRSRPRPALPDGCEEIPLW